VIEERSLRSHPGGWAEYRAARDAVRDYVAVLDVRDENAALRRQLAEIEEENLQLREALVASGRLERIAEMRDEFEIPMLPAELVGLDVSAWFRSALVDRGRMKPARMPEELATALCAVHNRL